MTQFLKSFQNLQQFTDITGIAAQMLVCLLVFFALSNETNNTHFLIWLAYMGSVSALWLCLSIGYRIQKSLLTSFSWLMFFAVFAFLSGCGWGILGYGLIPPDSFSAQSFIAMILFGTTAGALPFLAPFVYLYLLFTAPALIPLILWFFSKPSSFIFWAFSMLLYFFVLTGSAYYINRFLNNFLTLQKQNINLGQVRKNLENKVLEHMERLQYSLDFNQSILQATADGILHVDLKGNINTYNHRFLSIWDIHQDDISPANPVHAAQLLARHIKQNLAFTKQFNHLVRHPSREATGELHLKQQKIIKWVALPHYLDKAIVGRVWSFTDITQQKNLENELAHQATHDTLTLLPNRRLLLKRLQKGIAYAQRFNSYLILFFIDIDRFKLINDSFGHEMGDCVLKEIAHRLLQNKRDTDTVARFGGDEFILLFYTDKLESLKPITDKITQDISRPMNIKGIEFNVSCSIGASIYPHDAKKPQELIRHGSIALSVAKNLGRNTFKIYENHLEIESKKTFTTKNALTKALHHEEFTLLYQPIISLKSGTIAGVEVLIRWNHPQQGLLTPDQFLSIAEQSGLISQLDEWVMKTACQQIKKWQDTGHQPPFVSINISAIELKSESFIRHIAAILNDSGVEAKDIELELTETSIMENSRQIQDTLTTLKKMGFRLVVDDFGKGYSSLMYLKNFPIDKLKIDKSFVDNCVTDPKTASLLRTIISLSQSLMLPVVAEGVETKEQLLFLQNENCDYAQGYYFSPPVEADVVTAFLKSNQLTHTK